MVETLQIFIEVTIQDIFIQRQFKIPCDIKLGRDVGQVMTAGQFFNPFEKTVFYIFTDNTEKKLFSKPLFAVLLPLYRQQLADRSNRTRHSAA